MESFVLFAEAVRLPKVLVRVNPAEFPVSCGGDVTVLPIRGLGMIVSSSSEVTVVPCLLDPKSSQSSSPSRSVPLVPAEVAEAIGNMGVDGGYIGDIGVRANNGSTSDFHGP